MPDNSNRQVDPEHSLGDHQISFSDDLPLQLISGVSLKDLNRRLPETFCVNRSCLNLVLNNTKP